MHIKETQRYFQSLNAQIPSFNHQHFHINCASGMEVFAEGTGRGREMVSWIIILKQLLFQLPETAGYLWLDVDKRNVDA